MRPMTHTHRAGLLPKDPKTNRMLLRTAQYRSPAYIFAAVIDCNSIRRQTRVARAALDKFSSRMFYFLQRLHGHVETRRNEGGPVARPITILSRRSSHLLSDCAFGRGLCAHPERVGAAVTFDRVACV